MVQMFYAWRVRIFTGSSPLMFLLLAGAAVNARASLYALAITSSDISLASRWHRHINRHRYRPSISRIPEVQGTGNRLAYKLCRS